MVISAIVVVSTTLFVSIHVLLVVVAAATVVTGVSMGVVPSAVVSSVTAMASAGRAYLRIKVTLVDAWWWLLSHRHVADVV